MKRDNIAIERSIMQIQDWIIEGVSSAQIITSCLENKWCTSTRMAEKLIKRAKDRWVREHDASLEQRRAVKEQELIALKDRLQRKYKGTPQGILAIARVENLIINLMGLKAPVKVQLSNPDGKPLQLEHSTKDEIDYDALPVDVLEAIVNARKATH